MRVYVLCDDGCVFANSGYTASDVAVEQQQQQQCSTPLMTLGAAMRASVTGNTP